MPYPVHLLFRRRNEIEQEELEKEKQKRHHHRRQQVVVEPQPKRNVSKHDVSKHNNDDKKPLKHDDVSKHDDDDKKPSKHDDDDVSKPSILSRCSFIGFFIVNRIKHGHEDIH